MNGFIIHLQGPMMSFGDLGFGAIREAGPAPSRSAVIGILAAALGIERRSVELIDLHRDLRVHAAVVEPGELTVDYHTVRLAGYADHDPVRLRRSGLDWTGTRAGRETTLTRRAYHTDAHHVALIESADEDLIDRCRSALARPVYVPFLGRRGCPPATPLTPVQAQADSVVGALCIAAVAAHETRTRARKPWLQSELHSIELWLDGMPEESDLLPPSGWTLGPPAVGFRRVLLSALPRAYVNRQVTRITATAPAVVGTVTINEEYFDAAP